MKSFTLALVSHESYVRSRDANLERSISWTRKAAKAGADLVCLPELCVTGHAGHPAMVEQAELVPDGPAVSVLIDLATDLGIHICAGIAEVDCGIHYNTQFVVGPDGYLGKQRKIHLSRDEYFYFRGGTQLPVIDLPFVRLGIIICYDNTFPEPSRCLAIKGAELILAPHAARFGSWPRDAAGRRQAVKRHKAMWTRMHSARSEDNGVYVGLCNMVGRGGTGLKGIEANHAGGCMVFDPEGEIAAESRTRDIREEMVIAKIDARLFNSVRRRSCHNLQVRRPEVFSAITEPTQ